MASNATKLANEPADTRSQLQSDVEIQDVLFSDLATSVCYWITIVLLAVVGAYLIRWWLIHPGSYAAPSNDPWGITTPPWLTSAIASNRVALPVDRLSASEM
ncbi:MAG: hypothetical protein M3Y27_09060 [Acidobacteriota bacterium]|nr:hypothetical protein [Acidobacteriota bacterium]